MRTERTFRKLFPAIILGAAEAMECKYKIKSQVL
jgi:hypothetical protein